MLGKKSANKKKAIVPNIFIGGILLNVSVLKGTPEIITEAVLMVIPKLSWMQSIRMVTKRTLS